MWYGSCMSRAKSKTNLNVQSLVKGRKLLSVPINLVIPDPDRPNIRGKVVDTTDLQPSVREYGIIHPIIVRPVPGDPYLFYRIAGERRQVAARAVGLKEIPVIVGEDLEERDVRQIMLASDLHKSEPHIVLGPDGEVIAGKCKAVYEELEDEETETTRQDLADAMGVSSDIVGAYYVLYTDIPEIQEKVAKEQMFITAYSLIKHHGPEVKRWFAKKRGKVSANFVRRSLRRWKEEIQPKIDAEKAEEDDVLDMDTKLEPQPTSTGTVSLKLTKKTTVTELLGGAFNSLNKIVVNQSKLSGTDWTVVEKIDAVLEKIKNAE